MSLRMAVRKIFLTERNTGLDTPNSYPILGRSWKAAHIKVLVWYFTIKAIEFANATGVPKLYIRLATSLSCIKSVFFWAPKIVAKDHILRGGALCTWTLSCAIYMMDSNDILLSNDVAEKVHDLFVQHLLHWQGLWQNSYHVGIKRWKIRPKHHDLEHLALQTKRTGVNPRFTACFQDESYLGQIKHVAIRCHSSTVLVRVFQRILLNLSQRWKDTRERLNPGSWKRWSYGHAAAAHGKTMVGWENLDIQTYTFIPYIMFF